VHVADERDRPAEPDGSELQHVSTELGEPVIGACGRDGVRQESVGRHGVVPF
jgi:hypothetical protein